MSTPSVSVQPVSRKGGMELYLAAAVDAWLRASVPSIVVQSFRWALDHDSWQSRAGTFQLAVDEAARHQGASKADAAVVRRFYDRVAPGIYTDVDGPKMVPLVNGDSDARTPRPGLLECIDAAKAVYAKAVAPEAFEFVLQSNTGHRVNPDAFPPLFAGSSAGSVPGTTISLTKLRPCPYQE